jgi:hypothetical protein
MVEVLIKERLVFIKSQQFPLMTYDSYTTYVGGAS